MTTRRLERWAAVPDFDVCPVTRELVFAALATTLGGFADDASLARIRTLFSAVLDPPSDGDGDLDHHLRVAPLRDELDALLRGHLVQPPRAANVEASLIDHLRREEGSLSDDAVLSHLNLLLVTGHETTATLLAWLVYCASRPQWQGWLREELDAVWRSRDPAALPMLDSLPRLDAFVREVGRLNPPLLCAPRVCVKDVAIAGHRISAGSRVVLSYGGANMSASAFSEPRVFRPQRWMEATSRRAATFGAGHRHCLGMGFAHMELKIVLARIMSRYEIERGEGPEPVNAGFWSGRLTGGPRLALRPFAAAGPCRGCLR